MKIELPSRVEVQTQLAGEWYPIESSAHLDAFRDKRGNPALWLRITPPADVTWDKSCVACDVSLGHADEVLQTSDKLYGSNQSEPPYVTVTRSYCSNCFPRVKRRDLIESIAILISLVIAAVATLGIFVALADFVVIIWISLYVVVTTIVGLTVYGLILGPLAGMYARSAGIPLNKEVFGSIKEDTVYLNFKNSELCISVGRQVMEP